MDYATRNTQDLALGHYAVIEEMCSGYHVLFTMEDAEREFGAYRLGRILHAADDTYMGVYTDEGYGVAQAHCDMMNDWFYQSEVGTLESLSSPY